jgi:tetratricopeptide (TPR) repeat protein
MSTRHSTRLGVLAAALLFGWVVSVGPAWSVDDRAGGYPRSDQQGKKGKKKKSEQQLREGYQRAYALIMDGQYEAGIAAMHALGDDADPEIANYIGYASRKLGRYQDSKYWYEKALAADPNHVRSWAYYGMWLAEQGNMLKAQDFLEKVRLICGNTECEEYQKLKGVMEGTQTY